MKFSLVTCRQDVQETDYTGRTRIMVSEEDADYYFALDSRELAPFGLLSDIFGRNRKNFLRVLLERAEKLQLSQGFFQ